MKILSSIFLLCMSLCNVAHAQEDYQIVIDGQSFPVQLDRSFTYITSSGEKVEFVINKKESHTIPASYKVKPVFNVQEESPSQKIYSDDWLSFTYSPNETVAVTRPRSNFQQITLVSGMGSGIIFQEFDGYPSQQSYTSTYLEKMIGTTPKIVNHTISGKSIIGHYGEDDENNRVVIYSYSKDNKSVLITLIGQAGSEAFLAKFLETIQFQF